MRYHDFDEVAEVSRGLFLCSTEQDRGSPRNRYKCHNTQMARGRAVLCGRKANVNIASRILYVSGCTWLDAWECDTPNRAMAHKRTTILLGNGPNRLAEAAISWNDVLQHLGTMAPLPSGVSNFNKPLPLLFDEIALALERLNQGGPRKLKNQIADVMRPLSPNSVHRKVMALRLQDVLTTNYDYTLESVVADVVSRPFPLKASPTESRFSLFRHRDTGTSRVWHIHGEIDYPRTLQLGYEHYGAYLGRIHDYLTDGNRGHASPFVRGKGLDTAIQYSWIDIFLRDNVHIIGLTLDFSEIDLWWLLVYKERLRCKSRYSVGTTVYHHIHVGELTLIDRMRLATLEGIGVETTTVEIDGEWEFAKAYHQILAGLPRARVRASKQGHGADGLTRSP